MNDPNEFLLDEATRGWLAECNSQIQNLAIQMNGALNLICRREGLPGQWKLAPDGTKLVRIDQQLETPPLDISKKQHTNGIAARKR